MNRRDFLKHVPKTMCASGAAMYVAGKMLDQQQEVTYLLPKPELIVWRHEHNGHVWFDVRETIVTLDGTVGQRNWGETCDYYVTVEHSSFRRCGRFAPTGKGNYIMEIPNMDDLPGDKLNFSVRVPDWA